MSDITEALGTATEGSLFSKAVSKDGTPVEKGHFAEGACLNCGTQLTGKHCHECGQKAHLHRTIGAFFHDLLHGALHLDGKLWRTLPLLILKPGLLTRRYIDGERTSFVSPMALFLFSVFLMFAVFQAIGLTTPTDFRIDPRDQLEAGLRGEVQRVGGEISALEERLAQETLTDEQVSALNEQRAELELEMTEIEQAANLSLDWLSSDTQTNVAGGVPVETDEEGNTTIPLSLDGNTQMNIGTTGVEWIDDAWSKWRTNPGLMLYKLQANAYKFSWLLIPISIPFVWIMFAWKRRFKAYDHAIFVTYSIAFVSLLFITLSLLTAGGIGGGWVFLALVLVPPLHVYKHLKYTYGLSRFSALWRLFVLLNFITIIIFLFAWVLLLLGAF